ncbi:hypothetical protein EIN_410340 [Entamoeba invadens IP1]|uniref:Uncharacterized protein n=1 Tax=Entamoeba invadens IP1 TaxID=370355 RepID=A0A0A1TZS7_ENTIV|nr:hypothetical protein EIN_410340 [Entamoeba invadens IP1]ELP85695.1 hypothetical protein EIN_410340 [Entamoeba invadens IP1]|eukprot:XP_004185041.1 hypothetical protein EIN_410340 [Entamoeba invadens IP1]
MDCYITKKQQELPANLNNKNICKNLFLFILKKSMIDTSVLEQLLLDCDSGLLLSICRNVCYYQNHLMYDIDDTLCLRNATIVVNYFKSQNRLRELFYWAYKQEFLPNTRNQSEMEFNRFFTIFNRVYSLTYMEPFQIASLNKFLFEKQLFSKLEPKFLNTNKSEFTEEMLKKSSESYNILKLCVSRILDCISVNTNLVPNEYADVINYILRTESTLEKKKDDHYLVEICFSELVRVFIQCVIIPYLNSKRALLRKFGSSVEECVDNIVFVGETLLSLITPTSQTVDSDLSLLVEKKTVDILDKVIKTAHTNATQKFEPFRHDYDDIISLIQTSIVPIKRNLTQDVSVQLMKALEIPNSSLEDFLVYNDVLQKISNFAKNFQMYFSATLEEAKKKESELNRVKTLIENYKQALMMKKIKNYDLALHLEELKKQEDEKELDVLTFLRESRLSKSQNSLSERESNLLRVSPFDELEPKEVKPSSVVPKKKGFATSWGALGSVFKKCDKKDKKASKVDEKEKEVVNGFHLETSYSSICVRKSTLSPHKKEENKRPVVLRIFAEKKKTPKTLEVIEEESNESFRTSEIEESIKHGYSEKTSTPPRVVNIHF